MTSRVARTRIGSIQTLESRNPKALAEIASKETAKRIGAVLKALEDVVVTVTAALAAVIATL